MGTPDADWWSGLLLLAVLGGALGWSRCVGQDPQLPVSALPEDMVKEWRKVGAEVGFLGRTGDNGSVVGFHYRPDDLVDAIPAFRLRDARPEVLRTLCDVGRPFGLDLSWTQVTDAGVKELAGLKNLQELRLSQTQVTDLGLKEFAGLKNLQWLSLWDTQVTDAGMAYPKEWMSLQRLRLESTSVSDAGLADIASLLYLTELDLGNTRVSLKGYEQLKTAMPRCKVGWSEANRQVAETVLSLGGAVEISPRGASEPHPVTAAADLPSDYFQVRRVSLAGVDLKQITQTDLRDQLAKLRLPEFDRLESLDLSGIVWPDGRVHHLVASLQELSVANTGLTDDALVNLPALPNVKRLVLDGNDIRGPGLIHLNKWPELTELSVAATGLTDTALASLPALPHLKRLVLDGNDIRGPGLSHLKQQPELTELSLGCPTLTDLFAKNLAEFKQLKRLSLAGSGLGDAGIKHLAALTNLESLDLRRTKVTAAGVAELQQSLPNCRITWDGDPNGNNGQGNK